MLTLEKDAALSVAPGWFVLTGGEFEPSDLVECYRNSDPSQVVAYQAQYIVSGEFV